MADEPATHDFARCPCGSSAIRVIIPVTQEVEVTRLYVPEMRLYCLSCKSAYGVEVEAHGLFPVRLAAPTSDL